MCQCFVKMSYMISYLKGAIKSKQKNSVILVVGDVGYEVFLPVPALNKIKIGAGQEFFTHEYLRENSRELYGFPDQAEIRLFLDLIKVSGVGPRMALNVLSLGYDKVRDAISKGDAGLITTVSGVGKKTAQKIVLELKGILEFTDDSSQSSAEVVDALKRLGYSQREASEALQHVQNAESTEDKLKSALKILGKR